MSSRLQGVINFKSQKNLCPLCSVEAEDVSHFILRCPKFATEQDRIFSNASVYMSNNELHTDASKSNFILNLWCSPECILLCCEYISTIYKKRELYLFWVNFPGHHEYVYDCIWMIILLKVLINHIYLYETQSKIVAYSLSYFCVYVCFIIFVLMCLVKLSSM